MDSPVLGPLSTVTSEKNCTHLNKQKMRFWRFTGLEELKLKGKYAKNYVKILREAKPDKDIECLCLLI